MGLAASRSVARICDNASISDAHIAFRSKIAERGAWRSLSRVVAPPSEAAPFSERNASPPMARGAGLVVRARSPGDAEPVLDSLRRQTVPAGVIAVVCAAPPTSAAQEIPSAEGEILVLRHPGSREPMHGTWASRLCAHAGSVIGFSLTSTTLWRPPTWSESSRSSRTAPRSASSRPGPCARRARTSSRPRPAQTWSISSPVTTCRPRAPFAPRH